MYADLWDDFLHKFISFLHQKQHFEIPRLNNNCTKLLKKNKQRLSHNSEKLGRLASQNSDIDVHSMMGRNLTLKISNSNKISIFDTT